MSKYEAGGTAKVRSLAQIKNYVSMQGGHADSYGGLCFGTQRFSEDMMKECGKEVRLTSFYVGQRGYDYTDYNWCWSDWMLE